MQSRESFDHKIARLKTSIESHDGFDELWDESPDLRLWCTGNPVQVDEEQVRLISLEEAYAIFLLAMSARNKPLVTALWGNNQLLRNWLSNVSLQQITPISLENLIACFKLSLHKKFNSINKVLWDIHPLLQAWYSGHLINFNLDLTLPTTEISISNAELLEDFKKALITRNASLITGMWNANEVLRMWFRGHATPLRHLPSDNVLANFKLLLASRCNPVISATWRDNRVLQHMIRQLSDTSSQSLLQAVMNGTRDVRYSASVELYLNWLDKPQVIQLEIDRLSKNHCPSVDATAKINLLKNRLEELNKSRPSPSETHPSFSTGTDSRSPIQHSPIIEYSIALPNSPVDPLSFLTEHDWSLSQENSPLDSMSEFSLENSMSLLNDVDPIIAEPAPSTEISSPKRKARRPKVDRAPPPPSKKEKSLPLEALTKECLDTLPKSLEPNTDFFCVSLTVGNELKKLNFRECGIASIKKVRHHESYRVSILNTSKYHSVLSSAQPKAYEVIDLTESDSLPSSPVVDFPVEGTSQTTAYKMSLAFAMTPTLENNDDSDTNHSPTSSKQIGRLGDRPPRLLPSFGSFFGRFTSQAAASPIILDSESSEESSPPPAPAFQKFSL